MPTSRTQSSLKATAQKSSKLLSIFKKAVRSTFLKNSQGKKAVKGKEKPKYKLQETADIMPSEEEDDEGSWAFVYQEVLSDCVPPDRVSAPGSAGKGYTMDDLEATAREDQDLMGSRRFVR